MTTYDRRAVNGGLLLGLISACSTVPPVYSQSWERRFEGGIRALEGEHGGRLGVCLIETSTGKSGSYRGLERFALCSTFKLALAAQVLKEIETGRFSRDHRIAVSSADIVPYSPSLSNHISTGYAPILDLARAIMVQGDNGAANVLLRLIGGPAALTASLRSRGDRSTRLDRYEPHLNFATREDERDTTTPIGFVNSARAILDGDWLTTQGQDTLWLWMQDTPMGLHRLRAGVPPDWKAGDRTGTAFRMPIANKYNDVAMFVLPTGSKWIAAAYYEAPGSFDQSRPEDEAVLAEVGRICADAILTGGS